MQASSLQPWESNVGADNAGFSGILLVFNVALPHDYSQAKASHLKQAFRHIVVLRVFAS